MNSRTAPMPLAPSMLFRYSDAAGVTRVGYVERTSDHGGTDVTYFMRQWRNGQAYDLNVLSGYQAKSLVSLNTRNA